MKRFSKTISILLLITSILLSMTVLGCGEKETLVPPTIQKVYQKVDGSVYVTFDRKLTQYTPDFSIDNGKTWYQAQNGEGNSIQILTYNGETESFCSIDLSNQLVIQPQTINVCIREPEGPSTKATEASNCYTQSIKAPNSFTSVMAESYATIGTEMPHQGEPYEDNSIHIVNASQKNTYTFANKVYISASSVYRYVQNTSATALFEYVIVDTTGYTSTGQLQQAIEQKIADGQITFSNFTTTFAIEDSNYRASINFTTPSLPSPGIGGTPTAPTCATLAIRYKSTSSKLAGPISIIEIQENIPQ